MAKPYFPLYSGDYLRDTRGLSAGQHGAYLLLLMHLWDNDGTMPNSPKLIQTITNWTRDEYRRGWPKIQPFFTLTEGTISHKRVTLELEKRAKSVSKLRQAGAKGGRKTQQKQRNPQASAKASQVKDLTSSLREETSSLPDASDNPALPATTAPPSALEARGLVVTDHSRLIVDALKALPIGRVSLSDLDRFRRAVQGERAGRVVLRAGYDPPAEIAAIIETTAPQLKAIEGGKT